MPPSPLRAGLAGLVDYAGLFPPASLDLPSVVTRFAAYAGSNERWMLGRLIVPLQQLDALASLAREWPGPASPDWTLSVIVPAEMPPDEVGAVVGRFDDAHHEHGIAIGALEVAASTASEAARVGTALPPRLERYVEVAIGADLSHLLDAVARAGCAAKVRTGGVTADRIPSAASLARFVRETVVRGVPFKATAGLHHPLRSRYRLTYEPDSAWGRMHGFFNLVVATAIVRKDPAADPETVCAVLEEGDRSAFSIGPASIAWKGEVLTAEDLTLARAHALRSVGSCSFEEPVAELRDLGWLPRG
jgi:hypothetical protein